MRRTLQFVVVLGELLGASVFAGDVRSEERYAFFESRIRPVLVGKCLKCHGGETTRNALAVSSRDALLKGGDSGPALVAGNPDKSLLIQALRYQTDDLKMPPDKKLSDRVIADFEQWVREGAVWPKSGGSIAVDRSTAKAHWAFRPVRKTPPPDDSSGWSATAVDRFIHAALKSRGLKPTIVADKRTLQTAVPHVFAAGDIYTGASDITRAVGQGRRAAHMIDRWLQGQSLDGFEMDDLLPLVDKPAVLGRQKNYVNHSPAIAAEPALGAVAGLPAKPEFAEIEAPLTEDEARASAGDCLDCGVCSECHECIAACPADAIDLDMRERNVEVEVGAVIVSTGFKVFPADLKPQYGYGRFQNVITGVQMERLLAPTRPYNTVLRPGDGKVPERIAYVMCTGSRDQTVGNPLCSKFCCMYSIKQNQLIMGALPLADVTVHYIDIRAVGKGYDEFFEQSKAMGAAFVKGRVAAITETEDGNLVLRYEDIDNGTIAEAEYDLVVLAVGVQPNRDAARLFSVEELALDDYDYVDETDEDLNPGRTSIPGVFVAGAASGAKDIPESILHAGAAVAQAAAHLERAKVTA